MFTDTITPVTKYEIETKHGYKYTMDTPEGAKESLRRQLFEKFLVDGRPADAHNYGEWYFRSNEFFSEKKNEVMRKAKQEAANDGYESGFRQGRREAIQNLNNFYPEIIAGLKKIDDQEITKEVTNG